MRLLPIVGLTLAGALLAHADTTYSITIDVTEDGEDQLWLNGNTLEWYHISDFANGGVSGGFVTETPVPGVGASTDPDNPYILVSGTDSSNSALNFSDSDWYNGIQGADCGGAGHLSCSYLDSGFEFTLPSPYTLVGVVGSVSITTDICPGQTGTPATGCGGGDPLPSIVYQPTVATGSRTDGSTLGTLVADLNDEPDAGAHQFEITLTWTDSASVPEPATEFLGGAGLIALGMLRWAKGCKQGTPRDDAPVC